MSIKLKRIINNLLAILVLVVYPFAFTVNFAYALPQSPSAPSAPSSPTSPDAPAAPSDPNLPSNTTNTSNTGNPTNPNTNQNSTSSPTASSSNTNTGSDSTNNSQSTIDNDTEIGIGNDALLDNIVNVDAISGNNNADKNTGSGSVSTGNAVINGNLQNSANTVDIGSLECSTECDVINLTNLSSGNSNTGSGSDNNSSSSSNNNSNLGIDNNALLNNLIMFDADSGNNSASYNTLDGTIDTGDSDIILTAINGANNINVGYQVFNVLDDQTGDIIINFNDIFGTAGLYGNLGSANNNTGADSTNNSDTSANNTSQIIIDNDGNVINNYYLDANTGNNTADKNTGNGSITTGDANIVFNLINFLNNLFLGGEGQLGVGVVNVYGTLDGDIILEGLGPSSESDLNIGSLSSSNSTTGADSENNASASSSNNTSVSLANSAEVLNNINLDAVTGNNSADKNTGSGSITTGNTNANLNVTNIANNTGIGDGGTIWMVLVNNLGTWTGQLFNTGTNSGVYSPFFTFNLNPDGSLSASNTNTGPGSTNDASTNVENDSDIAITNTATITNNISIDANTGGNSASKNTGNGTISTGNVNVATNIINMLNNVFLGGKFAISIVNIFGSFLGDIRQGDNNLGALTVDPSESIAISPNQTTSSSNPGILNTAGSDFAIGGAQTNSSDDQDDSAMVLASNIGDGNSAPLQIARFTTDRGLFDDFKLMYLIYPVIFGVLFSLSRRVLVRR